MISCIVVTLRGSRRLHEVGIRDNGPPWVVKLLVKSHDFRSINPVLRLEACSKGKFKATGKGRKHRASLVQSQQSPDIIGWTCERNSDVTIVDQLGKLASCPRASAILGPSSGSQRLNQNPSESGEKYRVSR
jgi:hypothetical protein